ncbi:MAG: Crp/Fnr family transcriptional regulator [Actinomycetota bacterium]
MDPDRLKSIPLFSDLSRHGRAEIARWADEVDVPAGKHLVDQGDFAYEFFVIEDGHAEVTAGGKRLADLGPGEFFGEIALIEADRRTASVVALSPMAVIVMHARDFRAMEAEMPKVAERIQQKLRERTERS